MSARAFGSACAVALLVVPWLNPFAWGPASWAVPWLVSLGCAALVLLLRERLGAPEIATAWLVAGLISSAIGLLQYADAEGFLAPWINQAPPGEAYANLRQRNQFATLTCIALGALVFVTLARKQRIAAGHVVLASAMGAWLAVGNAASASRTGALGLVVLVGFGLLFPNWRRRDVAWIGLSCMAAYIVAAAALPSTIGLDATEHGPFTRWLGSDQVCASRLTLWHNVLSLIAERPLAGWGWGELDYAHFVTLYPGARFCDILDNAHNLPLHVAVELGVPIACACCGLLAWTVLRARPWRETDPARQLAWLVLTLIGLHSLLEYPLWYGPFQIAAGLCALLLWRNPAQASPTVSARRLLPAVLAGALIACCAAALWDYHRVSQLYLSSPQRAERYRNDTLEKVRGSWLFRNQVRFAELTTTELTPANAPRLHELASGLLHFSPEPRVIEKLVESAMLLGREDEARYFMVRFRAAFPAAYANWAGTIGAHSARPPAL